MPIYEYQCHQCSHRFEAIQKFSDSPLTDCPNCGKNSLEKVISAPQFQLKGTGWYVTDFKNSGTAKKEEKAADKPAETKKEDTKSSDSKS